MRTLRRLATLLLLAGLAGCSALKFGYNRADWLASWELAHFVDLQREQKQLFDERFRDLWRWHRSTQLALYASDLRTLAAALDQPLSAEQVEQVLKQTQGHVDRTVEQALPDTARVLQTLDDKQVQTLLAEMAERRGERAADRAELTEEERRAEGLKRMQRGLKRWIGSLTREQERRLKGWSRERVDSTALWQRYEETWAAVFAEVLARRRDPDFPARLATLFDDAGVAGYDEVERVEQRNRAAWVALMADLSAGLESRQRERLRRQIGDLAGELEELANTRV